MIISSQSNVRPNPPPTSLSRQRRPRGSLLHHKASNPRSSSSIDTHIIIFMHPLLLFSRTRHLPYNADCPATPCHANVLRFRIPSLPYPTVLRRPWSLLINQPACPKPDLKDVGTHILDVSTVIQIPSQVLFGCEPEGSRCGGRISSCLERIISKDVDSDGH